MTQKTVRFYDFDKFRLDLEDASLRCGENLVGVPPKALETLILLVENNGKIVSREKLMETIWRETFVEEANINYTVSQLRKILGVKDLIQTVPKRGYRFNGKVETIFTETNSSAADLADLQDETSFSDSTKKFIEKNKRLTPPRTHSNFRWVAYAAALFAVLILAVFAFRPIHQAADTEKVRNSSGGETHPETVEAMRACTRGRMILADRDTDHHEERAIEQFQQAITLDPTLAVAHAGLAEALTIYATNSNGSKSADLYAKAAVAVNAALELDNNSAEAFTTRGLIKRNFDWDWQGAEADYRRAIELKPDFTLAHVRYAHLLAPLGRIDEARAEVNRSYALDPLAETVLISQFAVLETAREYDEAIARAEEFLRINPDNSFGKRALATFRYHKGEYQKVIEIGEPLLEKASQRKPFAWLSLISGSYQKLGNHERAEALIKDLEAQAQTDSKSMYSLAMNYAETNRTDDAIRLLQKCFEMREERMVWIKVEPRFANLQKDSRFKELIGKMKLNP
jgi:DNA-binding winged helix-turn-helix (wHTH) protein